MRPVIRLFLGFATVSMALPGYALAQENDADALADFMACGRIDDAQDRLDCFDRVHARLTPAPPTAADNAPAQENRQADNRDATAQRQGRQAVTNRVERQETTRDTTQRREQAAPGGRVMRDAGPDDLDLPLETEITRFGMNSSGDYRLQIREGWVFERAGGPPAQEDMTGRTVTLEKNFMGNWRMKLPDEKRPYWISPLTDN